MVKEMMLVHYGVERYLPSKFQPVKDVKNLMNKPLGGLWTSPLGSKYDWAQWCRDEDFRLHALSTQSVLRFYGEVLVIDSKEDINKLHWVIPFGHLDLQQPLYRPLIEAGVDAVHLTIHGEQATRYSYPRSLYGWDCETVFVMNSSALSFVKYQANEGINNTDTTIKKK